MAPRGFLLCGVAPLGFLLCGFLTEPCWLGWAYSPGRGFAVVPRACKNLGRLGQSLVGGSFGVNGLERSPVRSPRVVRNCTLAVRVLAVRVLAVCGLTVRVLAVCGLAVCGLAVRGLAVCVLAVCGLAVRVLAVRVLVAWLFEKFSPRHSRLL